MKTEFSVDNPTEMSDVDDFKLLRSTINYNTLFVRSREAAAAALDRIEQRLAQQPATPTQPAECGACDALRAEVDAENSLFGTVARLVGANDGAMAKKAEATKLRAELTIRDKRIGELEYGARDILYEMDRSCGRDVLVSRIRMDKLASLLSPAKAEPKCAKCGGSRIWHSENGFLDIPCPDCGGTK